MTLGFLFLSDQAWAILFLHSHPGAIAFPVAIIGLLLKLVFRSTTLREVWRTALLVVFYICFFAAFVLIALFVPRGTDLSSDLGRKTNAGNASRPI